MDETVLEEAAAPASPPPKVYSLDTLVGKTLDERYAVEELLGMGGMGAVFLARQIRLRRVVALKVPRPVFATSEEFMARFEREAMTMAHVSHEHIVQVHDVRVAPDCSQPSFIVMEYVQGTNLEQYLRQQRDGLTLGAVIGLFQQIAAGLDAAHAQRIVHRDIKPSNIIVTRQNPVIKIMDFGIARLEMDDAFSTQEMRTMGTPAYMAPEQLAGGRVFPAADIYSFGVMIYQALTRQLPLDTDGLNAGLAGVEYKVVPCHLLNGKLPTDLWESLEPALNANPGRRPKSAGQLADNVENALGPLLDRKYGEIVEPASPPATIRRSETTVREDPVRSLRQWSIPRWKAFWGIASALVLTGVVFAVWRTQDLSSVDREWQMNHLINQTPESERPWQRLILDDTLWDKDLTPPIRSESLIQSHRLAIARYLERRIDKPLFRGQFSPEQNDLAALGTAVSADFLSLLRPLRDKYRSMSVSFGIEPGSVHWDDHAQVSLGFDLTGVPPGSPDASKRVSLLSQEDSFNARLVLVDGSWRIVRLDLKKDNLFQRLKELSE